MSKYNLPSFSISDNLLEWMITNTSGSLLQLGTGMADNFLIGHYEWVYSIEHDLRYVAESPTLTIHCPIEKGWYQTEKIKVWHQIEGQYDVLLIDGPTGQIGRSKFLDHLEMFNLNATLIVDDTHRLEECKIFQYLTDLYPQREVVHVSGSGKKASILV